MRITQTSYYLSVHHLVTKVPKRAEVGSFLKVFYKGEDRFFVLLKASYELCSLED